MINAANATDGDPEAAGEVGQTVCNQAVGAELAPGEAVPVRLPHPNAPWGKARHDDLSWQAEGYDT